MKKKFVYYVYKSVDKIYVYVEDVKAEHIIPDIENYILCQYGCGDYLVEVCTLVDNKISIFNYSERISI